VVAFALQIVISNFYCTLLTKDQRKVQDMFGHYATHDAMSSYINTGQISGCSVDEHQYNGLMCFESLMAGTWWMDREYICFDLDG
jgi:hypothetical protein